MKNKITKFLTILSIIFISFFINQNKAEAVVDCVWYSYESGIYYDSSAKTYKPVRTYNGNTLTYKLVYHEKTGADFTLSRSGKKFYDDVMLKSLKNESKCPDYIGVKYNRKGKNDYETIYASSSNYNNYIKTAYGTNVTMLNKEFETVEYSGVLDSAFNIEANDKDKNKDATPIYFSSVKTSYKQQLKLDNYDKEVAETFQKDLTGLADKGQKIHYKEEFYNATKDTWSNAITAIYKELKNNCSGYKNSNTHNKEAYLDLLDHDVFPDLQSETTVTSYESSKYKDKIPGEKCYNTVMKAKFMQESFVDWFKLVDWLVLTKNDNANDFDQFYKYYEFAHLYVEGGDHVRKIRNSLNERKTGNKALDANDTLAQNKCNALCHEYNPQYNSEQKNTYAYDQCLSSSAVNICKASHKKCYDKCSKMSSAYQACYDGCMNSDLGEDTYKKLTSNYEAEKENNDQTITDAIDAMRDILSTIKTPTLDVDFEPYEVTCDDVAIFHTFYVILEIMAPILVILFGTMDYAKAVMASDVEKMQKAKKNFPKRLGLLLLFVFIPLIVSFLIGEFSSTNSSLMYCIINGG